MEMKPIGRGRFCERPLPEDQIKLHPTKRQIAWMRLLNLHGALPSTYLFEIENKEISCRRPQHQLKRLWQAGYVYRPRQQRATENSNYNQYVYDLTELGKAYLRENGLWIEAVRPSGNWVHQLFVSCVTATIDIMCQRDGYRYIPPHEYLDGHALSSPVPFWWDDGDHVLPLAPDAVFAIDYGSNSFIAFALEADRNTEPNTAKLPTRKSDLRTIRQYGSFIGQKLYKRAYDRDAMMVFLYATVNARHAANFVEMAGRELSSPSYVAAGVVPEFDTPYKPPHLLRHLFEGPLTRAGKDPFTIRMTA
jgi:hypothetical protein